MRFSAFAAAAAVACALPGAVEAADPKINHVVAIMLENRSFSHMMGWLKNQNPEINGLTGNETCPMDPADPASEQVPVNAHAGYIAHQDPSHSIVHTTYQIFGQNEDTSADPGPMNGFIKNYQEKGAANPTEIMACFNETFVPVISEMAMNFGMFDSWYASVPGPTQVNRMYAMSGTSHGLGTNDKEHLVLGMPQKTIFEQLDENDLTWANYFTEVPGSMIFRYPRKSENWGKMHPLGKFKQDMQDGTLPTFSWVEPAYFDVPSHPATDQHPDHDVSAGERWMKDIYESFVDSASWNDTVLLFYYDEHGGFYDNVSPPRPVPNPDGKNATDDPFDFTRLGIRVPAVMVSPWIPKGSVFHEPETNHYDHTSVLATMKGMFDLPEFLTKRDAWAAPFDHAWSLETPRTNDYPTVLTDPPSLRHMALPQTGEHPIQDLQKEWVQLAGRMNGNLEDGDGWTVNQGHEFCVEQTNQFLGREVAE